MDEWMNKENLMYMYKGVSLKLKKKKKEIMQFTTTVY